MALYDKASLVLIPSQYKEGKLYNIKPLKDSFEFERGSAATRVNSDGLIEYVGIGEELVTDSGFDDASAWNPQSSWTIQDGKAVYDGINTHSINQSFDLVANEKYLLSFELSDVGVNNAYINVRFLDGTTSIKGYANYTQGTHTLIYNSSADTSGLIIYSSGVASTIDNVSIKDISNDTPRLDYSGTEPSLLLEPQRTNELPYSNDFEEWNLQTGVTFNSINNLSPSGENNATEITFSDSNKQLTKTYTAIANPLSGTIYVKGTSGETIQTGMGAGYGSQLHTLNGEWQRLEVVSSNGGDRFGINTFGGSTARTIQIYGAQLEEGSYATSYIPTNGQTETRLADVCQGGGDASVFNDSAGTLYMELSWLGDVFSEIFCIRWHFK